MAVVPITSELTTLAREVHRRRLLGMGTGRLPDFKTTTAETAVLTYYKAAPEVNDLRMGTKQLEVRPTDLNGKTVRVCWWERWPIRVFSQLLDSDAYIFVVQSGEDLEIAGWLPITLLEEAPVWWFEKDGERVAYAHEVDKDYLAPLPEQFDFTETCAHLEQWGALWDWSHDAWLCFGCERFILDAAERDNAKRILERERQRTVDHSNNDQVPEAEGGAER